MTDKRQQIKQLLFDNDKTKKWLQDKLPTSIDVYYLLSDNCKKFDVDDYDQIINVLNKEGFITSEIDRCKELTDTVLKIDSLLGNSLDLLNNTVINYTKDNNLSFNERRKVADMLDGIDLRFQNHIEDAKKILGIR